MNYEEITLNHLFRAPDLHADLFSEIEMEDKLIRLKDEIRSKEPQLKWQKVLEEIIGASLKLLDTKLSDILERGWEKYSEVNRFLNDGDFAVDETFMVPLAEHTITSEHHPEIEVRIGEVYVGAIDFELQLQLVLEGIILKIGNHKIEEVKAGKVAGSGSFSCEGIVIFESESSEIEF